jgi:hypothetical protein
MIRVIRIPAVTVSILLTLLSAQDQLPAGGKLNLVVVEGEGSINNIKQRTSRQTIVQVEDENHRPIAGATVTFLLPSGGPGGTFANGATTLVRTTGADGRASMTFQPNQASGQFNIRVTASAQNQQTSISITQSNTAAPGGPGQNHHLARTLGIAAGAAAGAVIGCRVANCAGWGAESPNAITINSIGIR